MPMQPFPNVGPRALLVVDMQNDFVRAGAPMEVADARATIPAIRRLIDAFRRQREPVLFTRFLSTPEPCLLWNWSPTCAPPVNSCRQGVVRHYRDAAEPLPCSEVVTELAPAAGEAVVDKIGYGGFHGTDLHDRLQGLGIERLVIAGTVTQICVEETAREAFHLGYRTTLVADGVSSFAPDLHDATLKNFAMKFGWVERSENLLQA